MFGNFGNSPEKRRKKALARATHPVMQRYLEQPLADSALPWNEVDIVALDFETTGLDPATEQILSYGMVDVHAGVIQLSSASHELVKAEKSIPESSAVIHHITDDQASNGRDIEHILPELLERLAGKVMLVHYNNIEQGFLDAACQRLYGSPFIIPIIDTLALGHRMLVRRNHALNTNALRLFNLRDMYKLPVYRAHNALNDAMTTAELFLALESEISPHTATPLKSLLV
jgi:DNA polymerase-3 subunit epsilon